MTKNELIAKISLLENVMLTERIICSEIKEELEKDGNNFVSKMVEDTISDISRNELKNMGYDGDMLVPFEDAFKLLKEFVKSCKMEEGSEVPTPHLGYSKLIGIQTGVTYEDGRSLNSTVKCVDEDGTYHVLTSVANKYQDDVDISLAEIKRGNLAEIDGKSKDSNMDVDVYVYENVFDEAFTSNFTLTKEDLDNAYEFEYCED